MSEWRGRKTDMGMGKKIGKFSADCADTGLAFFLGGGGRYLSNPTHTQSPQPNTMGGGGGEKGVPLMGAEVLWGRRTHPCSNTQRAAGGTR